MLWGIAFYPFLSFLALISLAKPLQASSEPLLTARSDKSWLWGWAWGSESTVSIVEHTPIISYDSRPGE